MFDIITSEELWKLKPYVLEKIDFMELLLEYGINVSECFHNSFKYRSNCPLPDHYGNGDSGEDRTPSFFISDKNKFHCFGCNANGSAIDFISKMEGVPDIEVLKALAYKYGLITDGSINLIINEEKKEKGLSVDDIIFDTYILIRRYREKHNDNKWVEDLSRVAEKLFNELDFQDWKEAISIKNKVIKKLDEREAKI